MKTSVPFTSSMRQFDSTEVIPHTESFFIIDGTTVIFNAELVDTTSVTPVNDKSVFVRLNLRDGTHVDASFELTRLGLAGRQIPEQISQMLHAQK